MMTDAGKKAGLVVKDRESIKPGDVIYVDVYEKEGLKHLKDGYKERLKYLVIAGKTNDGSKLGFCLLNSKRYESPKDPDIAKNQYLLRQEDYPEILDHDSWLNCTEINSLLGRNVVARKGKILGHLKDVDMANVLKLLRESDFIDEHTKKVFGIK